MEGMSFPSDIPIYILQMNLNEDYSIFCNSLIFITTTLRVATTFVVEFCKSIIF